MHARLCGALKVQLCKERSRETERILLNERESERILLNERESNGVRGRKK